MDPRIPTPIKPLLADYRHMLEAALPALADGCYLYGSVALGAFDARWSDVDFVTVLRRPANAATIAALAEIHGTVAQRYPRWKLEGSYLQWADLGQERAQIPAAPYVHENRFVPAGHFDLNHVTWWELKHAGIAVFGPPAATLPIAIEWPALIAAMHQNLNQYWVRYTREPRNVAYLLTDDGIQWAVLGVLRQLYSFREQAITSKAGAGRYALQHLPERWRRLVREALRLRAQADGPLYANRAIRAVDAVRFLRYVITTANHMLERGQE